MSFIRTKNNKFVVLATAYRKNGKPRQTQIYLGKLVTLEVKREKLLRLSDWSWTLKNELDDDEDNPKRTVRQEIAYREVKNAADKLFSLLAKLLKNKSEEYLEISTKILWQAVYYSEIIAQRTKPINENAQAISKEFQKILLRPFKETLSR